MSKFVVGDIVVRINKRKSSMGDSIALGGLGAVKEKTNKFERIYIENLDGGPLYNYNVSDFELVWVPKQGDEVEVSHTGDEWVKREFIIEHNGKFYCESQITKKLSCWRYIRKIRESTVSINYHHNQYTLKKVDLNECNLEILRILGRYSI